MQELKQKIAQAFMTMLETRPLDRITVKELAAECGVSRQSFYYYFDDIYNIFEWVFGEAEKQILSEYSDIRSWQRGFCAVLHWILDHRHFVQSAFRSIERDYIEVFMNGVLMPHIEKVVEEQAEGLNVTAAQKEFITRYFTLSFNAMAIEWIRRGMQETPEELVGQIDILVTGDFKKALRNFHDRNEGRAS